MGDAVSPGDFDGLQASRESGRDGSTGEGGGQEVGWKVRGRGECHLSVILIAPQIFLLNCRFFIIYLFISASRFAGRKTAKIKSV